MTCVHYYLEPCSLLQTLLHNNPCMCISLRHFMLLFMVYDLSITHHLIIQVWFINVLFVWLLLFFYFFIVLNNLYMRLLIFLWDFWAFWFRVLCKIGKCIQHFSIKFIDPSAGLWDSLAADWAIRWFWVDGELNCWMDFFPKCQWDADPTDVNPIVISSIRKCRYKSVNRYEI